MSESLAEVGRPQNWYNSAGGLLYRFTIGPAFRREVPEKVAYVENVAVGDALPDMPIFLTPDHYVPCPLEASYQMTLGVFPGALKGSLELPPK